MRLQDEPDIPVQINIIPMIDVIFAILTFFILSTLFLTKQQGLPVNLPKAGTVTQQVVSQKVTVTIDSKGEISLNRKPTTLENLTQQVQSLVGTNPETLVIINADENVIHGQVIAVMDNVRKVPRVKLAIAAQKP